MHRGASLLQRRSDSSLGLPGSGHMNSQPQLDETRCQIEQESLRTANDGACERCIDEHYIHHGNQLLCLEHLLGSSLA